MTSKFDRYIIDSQISQISSLANNKPFLPWPVAPLCIAFPVPEMNKRIEYVNFGTQHSREQVLFQAEQLSK
jgi:hypothetical protein